MHPPLVDEAGHAVHDTDRRAGGGVGIKRLFFDWTGVVAVAMAAMTYASLAGTVQTNRQEIERLRVQNDARARSDVDIAARMATKDDVTRLAEQVQALATEVRRARSP